MRKSITWFRFRRGKHLLVFFDMYFISFGFRG